MSDKNSQFAEKTEKIQWKERRRRGDKKIKDRCEREPEKDKERAGEIWRHTAWGQAVETTNNSMTDICLYSIGNNSQRSFPTFQQYCTETYCILQYWHRWPLSGCCCIMWCSPSHHLLLFVGGVATAADWMDGCWQEVQPVVFKVLIHQRQDDLRVKRHR